MGNVGTLRTQLLIASARAGLSDVIKGYNPDEARYPKGDHKGGEFAPKAGGSGGASAHPKGGDHPLGAKVPGHAFFTPNAELHPHSDDHGYPVFVRKPTKEGDQVAWGSKNLIATAVPGGTVPHELNGVPFKSWTPPKNYDWSKDTNPAVEDHFPPLDVPGGSRPAAGVVIEEPDGRVWLTRPTNGFGGYDHTFPKGSQEKGMSLQETAVKETWEETGLHVQITGLVGDFQRTTSSARYYTAKRIGGSPADMGWESQAVRLVPQKKLHDLVNMKADHDIVDALDGLDDVEKAAPDTTALAKALAEAFAPTPEDMLAERLQRLTKGFSEGEHPRWPKGTPLGGEFQPKDAHGVPLPPKLGSAKNPEHQAKADAIYGLLQHGDVKNAKAAAAKLNDAAEKVKAKLAGGAKPNFHDKNKLKLAQYADAAIAAKEKGAAASVKADRASEKASGPATLDAYKKAGAKPGGSNPGGIYTKGGDKFLVKGSNHTGGHQAHNEVLASKLIQAAGGGAPDQHVVDLQGQHGGGIGVASKWIEGGAALDKSNAAHLAAAREDFAIHAWLGNYDAIGQANDNTKIIGGKAVNIDPGGALLYRAQGAQKYAGMKMPHTVGEWDTLRDPKVNAQAASVYGGMTHSQLQSSAAKLQGMTDEKIGSLVDTYGPKDAKIAADLKSSLAARRDDILKKAGLSSVDEPKPSADEPKENERHATDGFGPGVTPKEEDFVGAHTVHHAKLAAAHAQLHADGDLEGVKDRLDYHEGAVGTSMPGSTAHHNNVTHTNHLKALAADLEAKQAAEHTAANAADKISAPTFHGSDAAKAGFAMQAQTFNAMHAAGDAAGLQAKANSHLKTALAIGAGDYSTLAPGGPEQVNHTKLAIHAQALHDNLTGKKTPVAQALKPSAYGKHEESLDELGAHPSDPFDTKIEKPTFTGKSADFWQGQADKIEQQHGLATTMGDVHQFESTPYTPKSGKMSPNATKLHSYHAAMLKDVKDKAASAQPEAKPVEAPAVTAAKATVTGVAPALPAKPVGMSSAANPNTKMLAALDQMEAHANAFHAGSLTKEEALAKVGGFKFGVNTYGKKATGYQASILSHIAGAEAGSPVTQAPISDAAKKASKAPKFDPAKITAPPSFMKWGGTGKPGPSSHLHINQANHDATRAIHAAALTGDPTKIANLTAPVLDKTTAEVTGEKPVLDHPSQHVKGYAQQALAEIDAQLNPPKAFRWGDEHPLAALDKAHPVAPVAGAAKVAKYVDLGHAGTLPVEHAQLPAPSTHANGKLTKSTYAAQSQEAYAKMPQTQKDALKSYTGSGYGKINQGLWSGNPTGAAKAAAAAINTYGHEIKPGTILSRKVSISPDLLNNLTGKVLQEPAVQSTAITPHTWSGTTHLKLHVGPGVKGLYVGPGSAPGGGAISVNSGENEMLLPPNTRMLITKVTKTTSAKDADGFGGGSMHVVEAILLPNITTKDKKAK